MRYVLKKINKCATNKDFCIAPRKDETMTPEEKAAQLKQVDVAFDQINKDARVRIASVNRHLTETNSEYAAAKEWAKEQHSQIVNQVAKELGYDELLDVYYKDLIN